MRLDYECRFLGWLMDTKAGAGIDARLPIWKIKQEATLLGGNVNRYVRICERTTYPRLQQPRPCDVFR
jgi:hypothetical protein